MNFIICIQNYKLSIELMKVKKMYLKQEGFQF